MNEEGAVGVFDSGVGGLTVLKEIISLLPGESTIYLGDTARVPYGSKPQATVEQYSLEDARFLSERKVKALVVACNTICCLATDALRVAFSLPLIGVIDPASKAAAGLTKNKRIGVIGTEGTINSGAYSRAIKQLDAEIEVFPRACPLFVPLVEEGLLEGEIVQKIVDMYLVDLREKGIDTLILGCTHYPLLKGAIARCMGPEIAVLDPATAVAEELKRELTEHNLLSGQSGGYHKFFFSGQPEKAEKLIRHLNIEIDSIEQVDLAAA